MSNFSKRLRRTRYKAHLTQADLARRVGVKQQTVARWERDASTPARDTLTRIAGTFGEPEEDWIRIAGRDDADFGLPKVSPPVRPRMDRLPLGELAPSEFERFTSYLLQDSYPGATVSRLGGPGHAQHGADIHVRTSDGQSLIVQCKRLQRFGPAQMKAAAAAAATTVADRRVLVLSRVASPTVRSTAARLQWDIWDHDDIVRMLQQELNPESSRRIIEIFFRGWKEDFLGIRGQSPWAHPTEFFAGQTEESAFSHSYELVGREDEIEKVLDWARSDHLFFLLTGAAGVGKSRFLMEAADRIARASDRPAVYFLDKDTTVILDDFGRLRRDPTFIVVDDAHDRDDLQLLIRGARSLLEGQRPARVLFATRDYGKPRIMRELAMHARDLDPPTVHLEPLPLPAALRLGSQVLGTAETAPSTRRLAAVTKDCTLFLVVAGHLLKKDHIDPAFLDDDERIRVAVLERMYRDYVQAAGLNISDHVVEDVLRFLAAVHPLDIHDEAAMASASRVLCYRRDVLTSALGEIVKTGVVIKRASRLRVHPDLLADHILVSACFDRTLKCVTGYADHIWKGSSPALRRNLMINVARIEWRLSETAMAPDSMLTEAWRLLERDFRESDIPRRIELLDLLEKLAFYQPERALDLVKWALDHDLPPEHTSLIEYSHRHIRHAAAPVLRACAYRHDWLHQACELLWRLAQCDPRPTNGYPDHPFPARHADTRRAGDPRPTNGYPDHPLQILTDLAAYSLYKPFVYSQQVIELAIEWLRRDKKCLIFDIMDQALQAEFEDRISSDHTVTYYGGSVLSLGRERVLALRDEVMDAVIQHLFGADVSLAVRATESLRLALAPLFGIFGRQADEEEIATWDHKSMELLNLIRSKLDAAHLSPPVVVGLRNAVEPAIRDEDDAISAAAEELLDSVPDDFDHQMVEVLIRGPWRRCRRHRKNLEYSLAEAQQELGELARRFLENSGAISAAVQRFEQYLVEVGTSYVAAGADDFAMALIDQRPRVGVEIIRRVSADFQSPLVHVTGVTLSKIRSTNAERALELARSLISMDVPAAKTSVAHAYRWGPSSSSEVSDDELLMIRELAADENVELAERLASGLRFMAEGDPAMALIVIRDMKIGRSVQLAGEVLGLFADQGPLDIDAIDKSDLDHIVAQLVECTKIDHYWIGKFLASLSRSNLEGVVQLLRRRVEYAESSDAADYHPVPYRWPDEIRLESRATRNRRRILQELREWASNDVRGWVRTYEAPRIFAAVASEFDDEVLEILEMGLQAPAAIAVNVGNLLSATPPDFVWSHVRWIVRVLEEAARRDIEIYRAICAALHSALRSRARTGTPGEPFAEDVQQRDEARKLADGLSPGSPGERFYRDLQRSAEHEIERVRERGP